MLVWLFLFLLDSVIKKIFQDGQIHYMVWI